MRSEFGPGMSISTFILIIAAVVAGVFCIPAAKASAERKRRLWIALKAGEPWAIGVVVVVAVYAAYVMFSYEPPQK